MTICQFIKQNIILNGYLEMDTLFRLDVMLSDFESHFKHKNFGHFRTFVAKSLDIQTLLE